MARKSILLAILVAVVVSLFQAPAAHAHAASAPRAIPAPSVLACPGEDPLWVFANPDADYKAWSYDFNGTTPATAFQESNRKDPADDLVLVPGSAMPQFTGQAAYFNDTQTLASKAALFDPDNSDFALCIKFFVNAGSHPDCNPWQFGNRHPVPSTIGEVKATPWYFYVESTTQRFFLRTDLPTMHGLGYKTLSMARRGNVFTVYVDGVLIHRVVKSGGLLIHLNQIMAVGGKIEGGGMSADYHDRLNGGIASFRFVKR